MKRQILVRGAIAASIVAIFSAGVMVAEMPGLTNAHAASAAESSAAALEVKAVATDFSAIVERFGPSVVNVSVVGKTQKTNLPGEGFGLDPNDPAFEFFRRFGPQFPRGPQGGQILRGQGSGFIVSSNGLILTNAHVIDGAQEVTVKLTDRREFKAKVLGSDKSSDVAVIQIDAKNLPVVVLGNPASTKVGEAVLAIGSPYGFENTATAGIVSAKSRSLPDSNSVPFIQTDVAVNPGNSGGPLFNLRGEVIGINSQIYSQTGGYQGLSFAIPIDVAGKVQSQIVKFGKVSHGRLGVSIQEVNQALSESFGLKKPHGALISGVEQGTAAEKAGLQPGDVIVAFDGHEIGHSYDLPPLVSGIMPGSSAKLDYIRNGSLRTVSVTVGEMKTASAGKGEQNASPKGKLGLAVRPIDKDERRELGVAGGLFVEDVSDPAARAGIRPGDVILSLNGAAVSNPEQLAKLLDKAGKHVALLVQRDSAKIFIPVDLG